MSDELTRGDLGTIEARTTPSPGEVRLMEIAGRSDLEKLKLLGKALEIVHSVVKSEEQIRVIAARRALVKDQIDGRLREAELKLQDAGVSRENVRAAIDRHREVVHVDIPKVLEDLPGLDAAQRKEIVLGLLAGLPRIAVST